MAFFRTPGTISKSTDKKTAFYIYNAAVYSVFEIMNGFFFSLDRSGDDLLFRALRRSTIGTAGFHFRVRDGTGWDTCVITTRSIKTKEGLSNKYVRSVLRLEVFFSLASGAGASA